MVRNKNSAAEKELDKVQEQFDQFDAEVKALTLDRMNQAPKQEVEPQTKLSQKDIEKSNDVYLKPTRTIGCRAKFNERLRDEYNFKKEYVNFIAENREVIGESIEVWTKRYPGVPAEFWTVPVNKPVWGPRYLAEQIKGCVYHRMKSQDRPYSSDHQGTYYGSMVVDETINRLDAHPVSQKKSIFMGANG